MSSVIEPATTGRAACRVCREKIPKGALRFGERGPSAFGEHEQTSWFHLRCAAERHPAKLEPALREYPGEIADRDDLSGIVAEGLSNPRLAEVARVERSPTGRATCRHCHEKISKDDLRVALDQDPDGVMPALSFIHARCAPAALGLAGLVQKLRRVAGRLDEPDRRELERALEEAGSTDGGATPRSSDAVQNRVTEMLST